MRKRHVFEAVAFDGEGVKLRHGFLTMDGARHWSEVQMEHGATRVTVDRFEVTGGTRVYDQRAGNW